MIAEEINFLDFAGNEVREVFHFNLTTAELARMAIRDRGFEHYLRKMVESQNVPELLEIFRELVSKSVGEYKNDRTFLKSPEYTDAFLNSDAYSELFLTMAEDPEKMAKFFTGMAPANLKERVDRLKVHEEKKEFTDSELLDMSDADFINVAGPDEKRWSQRYLAIAYHRKTARRLVS